MRGEGDVALGVAALEERAVPREGVQRRRPHGRIPVAAEVVGPQRVDRHQDDVRTHGSRRGRALGVAAKCQDDQEKALPPDEPHPPHRPVHHST